MDKKFILITGGLGYIGSNTIIELRKIKNNIIILDNLSNSSKTTLNTIKKLYKKKIIFIKADLRHKKIEKIFSKYKIDAVIHFAGLKSVKESEIKKNKYYDNNINGTINLIQTMVKNDCYKLIFSSSACVYDEKSSSPLSEKAKLKPKSFYGYTKLQIEKILKKFKQKHPKFSCIILRYFNPIGANKSGFLGDNPKSAENIIPNISNVIKGKAKIFRIFGNNYPTKDGTCLRDYVHITDLARSHIKSLNLLKKNIFEIINIGTGKPYSVKDLLNCFNKYLSKNIPYKYEPKRKGDVAVCFTNISKQKKILNFKPKFELNQMVKDVILNLK